MGEVRLKWVYQWYLVDLQYNSPTVRVNAFRSRKVAKKTQDLQRVILSGDSQSGKVVILLVTPRESIVVTTNLKRHGTMDLPRILQRPYIQDGISTVDYECSFSRS